jgi:hypothetical protein
MAKFTFTLPGTNKTFEIIGPQGLTQAQALAIFEKQASTGSLVGLKPGNVLSAATQAAAGLESAKAQLTAGIGAATAQLSGIAQQATAALDSALSKTGLTAPIDGVDFLKQATALVPVKGLDVNQLTGALAQTKNLVDQASSVLSNAKGLGEFGLGVQQLESAGIVKPGTAALVQNTGATVASVLKSPAVFTGVDGIKSAADLLASPAKQAEIQQKLMATGTDALAAVGIPVQNLNPANLAGLATNAVKDLAATVDIMKNLPVLPDVKAEFDKIIKDSAFAVNLVDNKLSAALKKEDFPIPAADTVVRDTLNAATTRIFGNNKIPVPKFGPVAPKK